MNGFVYCTNEYGHIDALQYQPIICQYQCISHFRDFSHSIAPGGHLCLNDTFLVVYYPHTEFLSKFLSGFQFLVFHIFTKIFAVKLLIFSYPPVLTYVLGAQKNRLVCFD